MASDTNSTENNPAKDSGSGHLAPSTSSTSVDDATATRLGQATANDRSATQATTSDVQEEPVSAGVVGTPVSDEDAKDEEDEEGSCSDSNDRRDRERTSSPIVVSDGEQIKDKDDEGLASKTKSLPINRVDGGAAANTDTADDGAGSKGDETVLPTPEAVGVGPGRIEEGGSASDGATETPLPPPVIATTVEDPSRRHDGGGDLLQRPSRHDISPAADDASATSPEKKKATSLSRLPSRSALSRRCSSRRMRASGNRRRRLHRHRLLRHSPASVAISSCEMTTTTRRCHPLKWRRRTKRWKKEATLSKPPIRNLNWRKMTTTKLPSRRPRESLRSSTTRTKKKPDLDDGEEDCSMPDAQLASRYEEMDAALKRAIKSDNDDSSRRSMPPAPGEAERIAAAFDVGDESIQKQPPPAVRSATTLEPGPVPSVSVVDEESPPPTVNDEIIGLGRGTNDAGLDDPLGNSNDDGGDRSNHGNNARQDEAGGGESNYDHADESIALHVPNAYLVEEDGRSVGHSDDDPVVIIDGYAEPLLPWWKQSRTRALLAFVTSVVIVATITVASVVTSSNNAPVVVDDVNAANANTTMTTLEIVRVVEASAAPSDSHAPTTSQGPSTSPTSREDVVFNTAELLELPEFDGNTLNTLTRAEGGNAIVATRVGDSIHLVFFASMMDDDHDDGEGSGESSPRWTRTDYFVEEYVEWDANEDIYDFHVALMDTTAFVGFPMRETGAGAGAGAVYMYERREQGSNGSDVSEGLWTKVAEPLLPDDGGNQGAQFGARIGVREADGLVTVTAYNDGLVYLFEKSNVSPDEDGATGQWSQLATLRLDYKPASCYFVAHDSIIVADVFEAIIHLYKYDRDDALLTQVWENGAGMLLTNFAVTDDYFAFTTSDSSYGQLGWTELGVSVYKRQEAVDGQTFALLQYFNSSDYDVGFGWELDMDKDMLIISGKNHTHVFLQQPNGYFEDTLMLNEPFDWIELSDRHLFIISRDSDDKEVVTTLNLEMCVQSMPTQLPSSSMAPSELHSVVPSLAPSFTSGPSTSTKPSHVPTFSLAPSICYDVTITIVTGPNTGKDGGVITWEFYEKNQSGDMIFLNGGGPLDKDQTYEQVVPCLMSSDFVFNITESEGKGFGECDSCGYLISVDGEYVAGNSYFRYNDVVNFPVPFVPNKDFEPCHGDFYFAITTDGNFPERTTWVLETYEGDAVLRGGPYHKPKALYTTWSCLSDGEYNFTILDSIGDDNAVGNYVLGSDFEPLVRSGLSFGTSNSTTFVSGPEST